MIPCPPTSLPVKQRRIIMLTVWILCNSWEVKTLRFLRKWSLRRIHWCECRLVSYHWSVPAFMYFFMHQRPRLCSSQGPKKVPEGSLSQNQLSALLPLVVQIFWGLGQKKNKTDTIDKTKSCDHVTLYPAFKHTFWVPFERFRVCFLSSARQIV